MRWWGVLVVCGACSSSNDEPPILTITHIESDCAVQPDLEDQWITDWIGLPEGCQATVDLSLDLRRMPTDAVVNVRTPKSGSDVMPVFDDAGHAQIAFTTPTLAGGWRDAEARFTYEINRGTNPVHTLEYNALDTIIIRPSNAPASWLWDAYWFNENRNGERFYDQECDDPISVVVWVGGNPAPGTYLKVSVYDVDINVDTRLEDGIVPVAAPGRFTYEPTRLCEPDREGATSDNVDPRFDVQLLDGADVKLDELAGPEIDL